MTSCDLMSYGTYSMAIEQIPRSTERTSSYYHYYYTFVRRYCDPLCLLVGWFVRWCVSSLTCVRTEYLGNGHVPYILGSFGYKYLKKIDHRLGSKGPPVGNCIWRNGHVTESKIAAWQRFAECLCSGCHCVRGSKTDSNRSHVSKTVLPVPIQTSNYSGQRL